MFRVTRVIFLLPLLAALGGCETSSFWDSANNASDKFSDWMSDFNPFGGSKKPLPGERKEVFPGGVPGVQQGVPPDLMRGQQNADALLQPEQPAPPPPEPKKKAERKKAQAGAGAATPAQSTSEPGDDTVWPPPPARGQ